MWALVVEVEQHAAGTAVETACTPCLEDFGQAGVGVSLRVDCLPLLGRDRGHMTGLGEEDRDDLFRSASLSLEFLRWALTWEKSD